MRSGIDLRLPADNATALCAAPARVLSVIDPARLRPAELQNAAERFRRLRASAGAELWLSRREAEELLAACDAVSFAIDAARVAGSYAAVVDRFDTFRCVLYVACSAPPRPTGSIGGDHVSL